MRMKVLSWCRGIKRLDLYNVGHFDCTVVIFFKLFVIIQTTNIASCFYT